MKKRYICNLAETCQVAGTSDTPPKIAGYGLGEYYTIACLHGVPHSKCWKDKAWECDRTKLSCWVLNERTRYERSGQDLIHKDRKCIEIIEEDK